MTQLLQRYTNTPGTLGHVRQSDRRLARALYERGVSLELVDAALTIATARRTFRPLDTPPLAAIRSLDYFLPVIEELLDQPPNPSYVRYLADKLCEEGPPHDGTQTD